MRMIGLAVVLSASLTLAPLAAEAQQAIPRIGWLTSSVIHTPNVEAFRNGMRALGHPGITIEVRAAAGRMDRLPALAAELVERNVQVIVTDGGPAAVAAKQATATIPIVIGATAADLVQLRLVASLARPGGNVTGFTISTGLSFTANDWSCCARRCLISTGWRSCGIPTMKPLARCSKQSTLPPRG